MRKATHHFTVHHATIFLVRESYQRPPDPCDTPSRSTCRGDATGGDRWPHVRLQAVGSNPDHASGAETGLARSTPWNPAPGRNPVSDLGRPKILRRGGPKLSRYKMRKPATASGRLAPLVIRNGGSRVITNVRSRS